MQKTAFRLPKSHLLQSKQPRTLHTKACKRRNILQLTQLRLHTKNGLILACGILFYEQRTYGSPSENNVKADMPVAVAFCQPVQTC